VPPGCGRGVSALFVAAAWHDIAPVDKPSTENRDQRDALEAVTDVLVTAYNEADRIGHTVDALRALLPRARVLVADDGSSDDTAAVARAAGAEVVSSPRNLGKGGAASLAAQRIDPGRDGVVLICDADLADSAARLAPVASAVAGGDADLAIAVFARKVGGGFGVAREFARWAIKRRSGLETQAPISGQRALTHKALAQVTPFRGGFGMEIGMTVDAARAGLRVAEVEVDLSHRATGRTLAGFKHRGRQLRDFVKVYWATRDRPRPAFDERPAPKDAS
jgi:glycosyltransferase involved in cell wall biosynthesis